MFYFTNKKCFETGRVLKNNHVKKEKKGNIILILLHTQESEVNSQEVRKICLPTQPFGSLPYKFISKNNSFLSSHLPKSFSKTVLVQ